jgi:hypothetical protein
MVRADEGVLCVCEDINAIPHFFLPSRGDEAPLITVPY